MENLASPAAVKALCARYGFTFSKALGQNFLIDPTVCPKIARMGGAEKDVNVLEIGPGFGVLTVELCKRAKRVVAVELDEKLLPVLEETLSEYKNVRIIQGDALKLDLRRLLSEAFSGERTVVCANLPYYVTSPVIMALLEGRLPIEAVTVMVQKEAANRICAEMGTRACGAVTAAVRYYSEPEILFPVPRGSFMPAPQVDSCVIRLNIRKSPPAVGDEAFLFRIIRAAFSQRRKILTNPVSQSTGIDKPAIMEALSSVGAKPTARAEELTLEQFILLAEALSPLRKGGVSHG